MAPAIGKGESTGGRRGGKRKKKGPTKRAHQTESEWRGREGKGVPTGGPRLSARGERGGGSGPREGGLLGQKESWRPERKIKFLFFL